MRRKVLVCSLLALSVFCLPFAAQAAGPALEKVLPASFSQHWLQEGRTSVYDPETLYEHINGEAELYRPYGFETLATARYVNEKYPEVWVVADVYRMGSLLDAFGIYSNYRRADDEAANVGADGFVSATQMMFYQDRYFVRLQATGTMSLDKETFLACARLVSGNLPANPSRPKELEVLAIPAITKKSERYLAQSVLGYAFFRRGLVAEAAVAGNPLRVFAVFADSPDAARQAFDAYRSYLQGEGTDVQVSGPAERRTLTAIDSLYGRVYLEEAGRFLIGAAKAKELPEAKSLVGELRKKVEAGAKR